MTLAIFDLDNTLIAGDSDFLWGEFLADHNLVDRTYYHEHNLRFLQAYERGELDIHVYLQFALQFLVGRDLDFLEQLRLQFIAERIEPLMLPKAQQLIAQHKRQGDHCLIITATNTFVTRRIADRLGIVDLIGTEPELKDGMYTGQVAGIPSFQGGKVIRLQEWLLAYPQHSLQNSYFYSDSHNDIPLLSIVSNPVAVDPDTELRQHAAHHGWSIMTLR